MIQQIYSGETISILLMSYHTVEVLRPTVMRDNI